MILRRNILDELAEKQRIKPFVPFADSHTDIALFTGRQEEISDLLQLVIRSRWITIYGGTGIGKSSLIYAGLSPELRKKNLLPVVLKVEELIAVLMLKGPDQVKAFKKYIDRATKVSLTRMEFDLGDSVKLKAQKFSYPKQFDIDQYFSNVDNLEAIMNLGAVLCNHSIISYNSVLIQPVYILDQFEKAFHINSCNLSTRKFLIDLLGFATKIPDILDMHSEHRAGSNIIIPRYRFILSLRSDYMLDLESLSTNISGFMSNRYSVDPLNRSIASSVIDQLYQKDIPSLKYIPLPSKQVQEKIINLCTFKYGPMEQQCINPGYLNLLLDYHEKHPKMVITKESLNSLLFERFEKKFRQSIQLYLSAEKLEKEFDKVKKEFASIFIDFAGKRRRPSYNKIYSFFRENSSFNSSSSNNIHISMVDNILINLLKEGILSRNVTPDVIYYELAHDKLAEALWPCKVEYDEQEALKIKEEKYKNTVIRWACLTLALFTLSVIGIAYAISIVSENKLEVLKKERDAIIDKNIEDQTQFEKTLSERQEKFNSELAKQKREVFKKRVIAVVKEVYVVLKEVKAKHMVAEAKKEYSDYLYNIAMLTDNDIVRDVIYSKLLDISDLTKLGESLEDSMIKSIESNNLAELDKVHSMYDFLLAKRHPVIDIDASLLFNFAESVAYFETENLGYYNQSSISSKIAQNIFSDKQIVEVLIDQKETRFLDNESIKGDLLKLKNSMILRYNAFFYDLCFNPVLKAKSIKESNLTGIEEWDNLESKFNDKRFGFLRKNKKVNIARLNAQLLLNMRTRSNTASDEKLELEKIRIYLTKLDLYLRQEGKSISKQVLLRSATCCSYAALYARYCNIENHDKVYKKIIGLLQAIAKKINSLKVKGKLATLVQSSIALAEIEVRVGQLPKLKKTLGKIDIGSPDAQLLNNVKNIAINALSKFKKYKDQLGGQSEAELFFMKRFEMVILFCNYRLAVHNKSFANSESFKELKNYYIGISEITNHFLSKKKYSLSSSPYWLWLNEASLVCGHFLCHTTFQAEILESNKQDHGKYDKLRDLSLDFPLYWDQARYSTSLQMYRNAVKSDLKYELVGVNPKPWKLDKRGSFNTLLTFKVKIKDDIKIYTYNMEVGLYNNHYKVKKMVKTLHYK